jgi:hypothetical protein
VWLTVKFETVTVIAHSKHVIHKNQGLAVRECGRGWSIHWLMSQNLTEGLEMHCVSAKFVPRLLTDDQKHQHISNWKILLIKANEDKDFFKNVITGSEVWVYGYYVETKEQSSQWKSSASPHPKKAQVCRNMKAILIDFFNHRGIIHYEFTP